MGGGGLWVGKHSFVHINLYDQGEITTKRHQYTPPVQEDFVNVNVPQAIYLSVECHN